MAEASLCVRCPILASSFNFLLCFALAAGVDSEQESTFDLRFKGADDDDVASFVQYLSQEDSSAVSKNGRSDDRLQRMQTILAILFRLKEIFASVTR